jgi:hypothetical protein
MGVEETMDNIIITQTRAKQSLNKLLEILIQVNE